MADHKQLDRAFHIGIWLKGLDGGLEIIGALLFWLVPARAVTGLAQWATERELNQDPHDFIANHILTAAQHFGSGRLFGGAYLMIHGLIKVVLVAALLKDRLWAYPASLAVLGLFMVYQIYVVSQSHSIGLVLLTLFDAVVVWLIWREYQLRRVEIAKTEVSR